MGGRGGSAGSSARPVLVVVALVIAAFVLGRVTAPDRSAAAPSAGGATTTSSRPQADDTTTSLVGVVSSVTDGDTIRMGEERVRIIGIDTPERGSCGFSESGQRLRELIDGRTVSVVGSPGQARDRYRRLLGYVMVGEVDAGRVLIGEGHAVARYDSRDGYPAHPREDDYRRLDAATPDLCG